MVVQTSLPGGKFNPVAGARTRLLSITTLTIVVPTSHQQLERGVLVDFKAKKLD